MANVLINASIFLFNIEKFDVEKEEIKEWLGYNNKCRLMKYLKRFNESINEDWDLEEIKDIFWDLEEIKDIFQDFLDEGFTLDDVSVGSSLTIAPKLWCPSHEDFSGNKSFPSVTIKLDSVYKDSSYPKYDFIILDTLDESIKHFESYYKVKLDSIFTVGLRTRRPTGWGFQNTIYNWFNSCETIKDIAKAHNLTELSLSKIELTFNVS